MLSRQVSIDFENFLKKERLSFTRQRRLILEKTLCVRDHFTVEKLIRDLRRAGSNVSRATVYRTVTHLEKAGLIRRIDLDDHTGRYEVVHGKKHHEHLICRVCGRMIDFTDERFEKITAEIAARHNIRLDNHSVEIYGTCAKCQHALKQERTDERRVNNRC